MADNPTPLRGISLGFEPGDIVIVTGAASGIGAATARSAVTAGLRVAAWDLDAAALERTVDESQARDGQLVAITADVTDPDAVARALERSAGLGPLRYLVNNAGPASASELDFDSALTIAVGSMRGLAQRWLDSEPPAGAALVNVASVAGNLIGTSPDWYAAAKAGIMGYTRHLAAYRSDAIRANAVAPGLTDTPRVARFKDTTLGRQIIERIPLRRPARPDEIAWAILFLLSPLASYINGAMLTVDGGWTITQ